MTTYSLLYPAQQDRVEVHAFGCTRLTSAAFRGDTIDARTFTTPDLALIVARTVGRREVVSCGCTRHEATGAG